MGTENGLAKQYTDHVPGVDQAAIEVYLAMLDCAIAHRTAQSRLFRSLEIRRTQGRFAVLRALLFSNEGRLSHRDIRNDVRVTSPNVTQLIDGLERDRLVKRVPGQNDRRISYVVITDAGRKLAEALVPAMARFMATSLVGFSEEEKALFLEFLARFRKNIEGAPDRLLAPD